MSDLSGVFLLLLFCTLLTGGIVGAGVLAQRDGPVAEFVRRHVRGLWLVLGVLWALAAAFHFLRPSPHAQLQAWLSLASFLLMVALSVIHRPANPADLQRSPE